MGHKPTDEAAEKLEQTQANARPTVWEVRKALRESMVLANNQLQEVLKTDPATAANYGVIIQQLGGVHSQLESLYENVVDTAGCSISIPED